MSARTCINITFRGNGWLLFSFSIFTDQTKKRMFQWYIPPHCYGYRVTPANIKGNYFT